LLLDLGFPRDKSEYALFLFEKDVEQAAQWIVENIDEPVPAMGAPAPMAPRQQDDLKMVSAGLLTDQFFFDTHAF
jgi:uncharacterized UBP type Zn finger protein